MSPDPSSRLFKELFNKFGQDVFVLAVDDGSVRQPLPVESLMAAGLDGLILRLRRNVGHQRAIAIGLSYVSDRVGADQVVIVMDSDGEDMPSTIPELLDGLKSDSIDVAVAQRKSRVETLQFKLFYVVYKAFFKTMTGRKISFGNFMALRPAALRRIVVMHELPMHIAAVVLASKLRVASVPIDRGPRYAGHSKMNFVGLALHGFRALMVFAEDVLVRVGIACAIIAGLALVGSTFAIVLKLVGLSTPGWFSIALGVLVVIFLQTGALALLTLMLTGVVRGATVTAATSYQDFIEHELDTAIHRTTISAQHQHL